MLFVVILSFALLMLALYWLYSRHRRAFAGVQPVKRSMSPEGAGALNLQDLLPQVAPHDRFPWGTAFAQPSRKAMESRRWELLADIDHRAFWYCPESTTLGFWRIGVDGAAFWQERRLGSKDLARLRAQSAQHRQSPPGEPVQTSAQQHAVGF